MKRTMWRSGSWGALSGIIGGWFACFVAIAPFLIIEQFTEFFRNQSVLDMATAPGILMFVWLPATVTGCLTGFISGCYVVSHPKFLYQWPSWGLVGAVAAMIPLFLLFFLFGGLESVLDTIPILFFPFVPAFIGGLVARFVYGMLQRRFLPELQMN